MIIIKLYVRLATFDNMMLQQQNIQQLPQVKPRDRQFMKVHPKYICSLIKYGSKANLLTMSSTRSFNMVIPRTTINGTTVVTGLNDVI